MMECRIASLDTQLSKFDTETREITWDRSLGRN